MVLSSVSLTTDETVRWRLEAQIDNVGACMLPYLAGWVDAGFDGVLVRLVGCSHLLLHLLLLKFADKVELLHSARRIIREAPVPSGQMQQCRRRRAPTQPLTTPSAVFVVTFACFSNKKTPSRSPWSSSAARWEEKECS